MDTEEYFKQRARRANRAEALRILEKAGKRESTVKGDELPAEWSKQARGRISSASIRQKKKASSQ